MIKHLLGVSKAYRTWSGTLESTACYFCVQVQSKDVRLRMYCLCGVSDCASETDSSPVSCTQPPALTAVYAASSMIKSPPQKYSLAPHRPCPTVGLLCNKFRWWWSCCPKSSTPSSKSRGTSGTVGASTCTSWELSIQALDGYCMSKDATVVRKTALERCAICAPRSATC